MSLARLSAGRGARIRNKDDLTPFDCVPCYLGEMEEEGGRNERELETKEA